MKEDLSFKVNVDKESFVFPSDQMDQSQIHQLDHQHFQLRVAHSHYNAKLVSLQIDKGIVCLQVGRKKKVIQIEEPLSRLIHQLGFNKSKSLYDDALLAPMPGLVLDIRVHPGQSINKGDHLITLEAMKMENILRSQHSGIVKEIKIKVSEKVEKNQTLILFELPENGI
ncbi:MAG: acetyl-CoA carboxylase biotin carboxyl carrier protein subunit [Saprospiraceae bacterium]|nr:acetyl-CoA carboxylase biotin carboxyl carrier protein subunit [Saprospiraceae bacterium]